MSDIGVRFDEAQSLCLPVPSGPESTKMLMDTPPSLPLMGPSIIHGYSILFHTIRLNSIAQIIAQGLLFLSQLLFSLQVANLERSLARDKAIISWILSTLISSHCYEL